MTINGQRVDLEVQVADEGNYAERSLYYWAREFSSALSQGGDYSDLPRTVVVSIVAFNLFGDFKGYHSEYEVLEIRRGERLTDKLNLQYFELPKLPEKIMADDKLGLWLSLFAAESEGDLEELEALEMPEISETIEAYRKIVITPKFKELERLRSRARHDEASALRNAELRGEQREKLRSDAKLASVIADNDARIADKDAKIADKDAKIADKDAKIADKDAKIAELERLLAERE